jgi:hypothetical protein
LVLGLWFFVLVFLVCSWFEVCLDSVSIGNC